MSTPRPIRLATVTGEDIATLKARMPRAFERPPVERFGIIATLAAATAGFIALVVHFDLTPMRLADVDPRAALLLGNFFDWSKFATWDHATIFRSLVETVAMALVGTSLAAMVALPLAFLAARNVLPLFLVRFAGRRMFDVARGVDQVIWALMFITAVGLGPVAGILAIFMSDLGTLGKLFSEAIENAERGQVEGVVSTGAHPVAAQRFGMLPQILPVFISQALYLFESNTRSATVLGLVGAGGIGFELISRWNVLRYDEVAYIILLLVIAVSLIDLVSTAVRSRLIGSVEARH